MIRRLFAAMYETASDGSEAAGMREERRQLLAGAEGATIVGTARRREACR